MKITIKDYTHPGLIDSALQQAIYHSRFTAETWITNRYIRISKIRLRELKHYCGNHPGACQIAGKHGRRCFLEGADWVEFNDLLNDVLDRHNVSARVESDVVLVRQGKERCTEYYAKYGFGPNAQWQREGYYEDYCGREAPPSEFPMGTPGIYTRTGYNVEG